LLKADEAPPLTFFELAEVREPLPPDARAVLSQRAVRSNHVTSLMLEGGDTLTGPWSTCADAACSSMLDGTATVQITRPPTGPSAPIAFKVTFATKGQAPESHSLETHDQVPVVSELAANPGAGTLVVTPYYLADRRGPAGQALLGCKRR
jgi:hypothetical protein